MPQKITFIGSGQITAVFAGLLAYHNRALISQGQKPVEISILGRGGSESLAAMKQKGVTLNIKARAGEEPSDIIIKPEEFSFIVDDVRQIRNESDGNIIPQDHIFVATKAFDHGEILESIKSLKDQSRTDCDNVTTVIFAQNGIPDWFLSELPETQIDKSKFKTGDQEVINSSRELVLEVGRGSIVGCILNVACSVDVVEGRPNYGRYKVSTPFQNIGIPMDCIDGEYRNNGSNIANLQRIFGIVSLEGQKLDVTIIDGNIRKEMLRKLQINAAVNGPCTITGETIGGIINHPQYSSIVYAASTEVSEMAKSIFGIDLRSREDLESRLERSAAHPTSMAIDFDYGKNMEVGAIYKTVDLVSRITNHGSKKIIRAIAETLEQMQLARDNALKSEGLADIKSVRIVVGQQIDDLSEMANKYRPPTPQRNRGNSASSNSSDESEPRKRIRTTSYSQTANVNQEQVHNRK